MQVRSDGAQTGDRVAGCVLKDQISGRTRFPGYELCWSQRIGFVFGDGRLSFQLESTEFSYWSGILILPNDCLILPEDGFLCMRV